MVPFEIVYRKPGKPANVLKHEEREELAIRCTKFKDFCMDALNGLTLTDRKNLLRAAFEYMMIDEYPEYYADYLDEFIKEVEKDEQYH